jgi:hypothetical protein
MYSLKVNNISVVRYNYYKVRAVARLFAHASVRGIKKSLRSVFAMLLFFCNSIPPLIPHVYSPNRVFPCGVLSPVCSHIS